MRNAKYVCFKHKHSGKRGGLCPTCREKLFCIGDIARIPTKSDLRGWNRLKEWARKVRNYSGD